jgi:ubiquitin-conjugating enzyme E2 O
VEEDDGVENESPQRKSSPQRKRSVSALEKESVSLLESLSLSGTEAVKVLVSPRVSVSNLSPPKSSSVEHFALVETASDSHRYRSTPFQPSNSRNFLKTVQREISLLRENLPRGILVKGYEDRMV